MERKTSVGSLIIDGIQLLLFTFSTMAVTNPSFAEQTNDVQASLERAIFAVEMQFSDGSRRYGQTFVVGLHHGGTLLVTVNSVLRSEDPDVVAQNCWIIAKDLFNAEVHREPLHLVEFRDRAQNLGLLYILEGKFNQEWPLYDCVLEDFGPGANVQIARCDRKTGVIIFENGRLTQGFENGKALVQIAKGTRDVDEMLGAPVLVNGSVIGILVAIQLRRDEPLLRVLSIIEVIRFLAGYQLKFSLEPNTECFIASLPVDRPILELRDQLSQVLVLKRTWRDIQKSFTPKEADLITLFGAENYEKARIAIYDALSKNSQDSYTGPQPRKAGIMTECQKIQGSKRIYDLELLAPEGVICCSANWEGNNRIGYFYYVNRRWIRLP